MLRSLNMFRSAIPAVAKGQLLSQRAIRGLSVATDLGPLPETEVSRLESNMRIATQTYPSDTVTVGVWINSGTRFESPETNGAAHFLEHMAFKGTEKRNREQLEVEIENMGGTLNAYTSREHTVYYAKVFKDDTEQAVDIISDILLNSKMETIAINHEKQVIMREKEEVEKIQQEKIFDDLHEMAFQGSPLSMNILGSDDQIKSVDRDMLQSYIKTHYKAPRFVLVGAGDIDHMSLRRIGEKHFSNLPSESVDMVNTYLDKNPSRFTGSMICDRNDDEPELHAALAWEGSSWNDGDSVSLMVLQSLLGSWDEKIYGGKNVGSKMCARVADHGGCKSISTFQTMYSDTGLFGVYFVAKPESYSRIEDLTWHIMYEIVRNCYEVGEQDLTRAKMAMKSGLLCSLDDTTSIAEDIGRQLLTHNRRIPLNEMMARIDAVDEEAIKRVAMKYTFDREMSVAAFGPTAQLPDYNWIRRRNYSLLG